MDKDEVRKNRERIRSNMKSCLVSTSQIGLLNSSNSINIYTPQIVLKKKRKTSEDIRILDDITYLKQIYVEKAFQDLFQLQQKIGEGAHSTVFKCREIQTGLIYAAKIFKTVEYENLRQIKQHYRIKKSLPHQNIIKAYYLFINEKLKKVHMICEYCPYSDLREYMKKTKNIKQSVIAFIIQSIFNGLAYLHNNGVCHRDIKAQNILYSQKTNELKIIDFQIAKMCKYTNQRIQMWTNTGTLHYKAPQMFNGSYNESIDVWATGVIAYELVYRKFPFQNQYLSETIKSICQNEPEYQIKQVSSFLISLIKKCLTKNALKRISSIQAIQTPFLLGYQQSSSASSPRLKRKSMSNTDEDDEKTQNSYNKSTRLSTKQSYSEDDLLNQKETFSQDIGIRFFEN